MEQQFLIPANSKRSKLIFSAFRPIDLIIAGTGAMVTFLMFIIFKPESLFAAVIVLAPFGVTAFLVLPVANYHNVLCVLTNIYKFYSSQQRFSWKGWCVKDEYDK